MSNENKQHQGEPVAWTWQGILDKLKGYCPEGVTVFPNKSPGVQIPLYTHADPDEVERLRVDRDDLQRYADELNDERCGFEKKIDTLRIQLVERDALLQQAVDNEESFNFDHSLIGRIKRLLSASSDAGERICTHPEGCTHCSWCGFESGMAEPGILKDLTHKGPPAKPTSSLVHYGAPAREMPCGAPVVTSDRMLMQLTQVTKPNARLHPKCTVHKDANVSYSNSTTPVECDERAAFESIYPVPSHVKWDRDNNEYADGRYADEGGGSYQPLWEGWQARAALERKQQKTPQ